MAGLNLEEKGLLQVLERIERGEGAMAPSTRLGLAREGLIEGDRPVLSPLGQKVLGTLRLRTLRLTGEFPTSSLQAVLRVE